VFPAAAQHRALERFEILRPLGSGGAGQVFLAKSRGGRRVAIKVLSDARERDEAFATALSREASLCARLTHPAIVQVRAFVEDEGFAAIVFDYVDGIALARLLRFCSSLGARLPDRIAWHVVERVLSALAYAHTQKDENGNSSPIVHRDVSPSNVLISFAGDVMLTDFGIAKMLGVSPTTQFGLVKGTLGCMAPEQARGEPVDERADVYAAGLLAWRLATGRAPFRINQNEAELLRAMRYPRIKPLPALRPDLPEDLAQAVAAALIPEARDRTIGAGELAAVVRKSFDVDRGHSELAELLQRWRAALDRPTAGGATSTDSSANHKHATLNYDEAAAIDDGPPADGPTLDTHALPGDEELWKSLAVQGALGLPRASASESEAARASQEAIRIAKETPLLAHAPIRDVPIVYEGAAPPPAPVEVPSADPEPAPAPPPVASPDPVAPPADDTAKRRAVLLISLAIAALLVGAALARLAHDATRDRGPSPAVTAE
jgi:eukaryotic-like serine/threonine-protein kinase